MSVKNIIFLNYTHAVCQNIIGELRCFGILISIFNNFQYLRLCKSLFFVVYVYNFHSNYFYCYFYTANLIFCYVCFKTIFAIFKS